MEQPRDNLWWETGEDLYMRDFEKGGFTKLDVDPQRPDLKVGDVFLFKLRSKVANHAGVYIGNGLIFHHVQGYTSHRAPLNLWGRNVECWLRYTGPV
jgi:cell wall-associated NlpC family hydrolase